MDVGGREWGSSSLEGSSKQVFVSDLGASYWSLINGITAPVATTVILFIFYFFSWKFFKVSQETGSFETVRTDVKVRKQGSERDVCWPKGSNSLWCFSNMLSWNIL